MVNTIVTSKQAIRKYKSLEAEAKARFGEFSPKDENTKLVLDFFNWEFLEVEEGDLKDNHAVIDNNQLKFWWKSALKHIGYFGGSKYK